MARRSSFIRLVLLLLVVPARLVAQDSAGPTLNFVFRMAQFTGSEASCILVQNDGKFHLEQRHRKTYHVFHGTLTGDHLAALHALLNDDRFQHLLPEAVSSSLLPTGLDELAISVPRQGHWVTLRFLAGVSSDRSRPLLNQFLKWNGGVLKGPHQKLSEESARNNCLPPDQIDLQTRPQ